MAEKSNFGFGRLLRHLRETAPLRNGYPLRRITGMAVAAEVGMSQAEYSEIEGRLYLPGKGKQKREEIFHKLMRSLAVGRRSPEYNVARDLLVRESLNGFSEEEIKGFIESYKGDEDLERRVQEILNS